MKFHYGGFPFYLEFSRFYKPLRTVVSEYGTEETVYSWFPSTTVNIRMGSPIGDIYRTATVGCWHREEFTNEKGRIHALRLISRTLDKDMKAEMWKAYMNRPKGNKLGK